MLTRQQVALLSFIDKHLDAAGFSPSFHEMADALGLKSKSGIFRVLAGLEERGFILRRKNRSRAITVLRMPDDPRPAPETRLERAIQALRAIYSTTHDPAARETARVAVAEAERI